MIRLATSFTGGLSAIDFALKYENIKYKHIFGVEIDKYARKQCINFHGEPDEFHHDVTTTSATHLKGKVDLYVFGSSCQDLSLAGKRKGFEGEKSVLFRDGARLLGEMKPKAFIFENVKGLLSSNGGADYKEVEKTFRELGYHMAMKVVNAKQQGTAQNRERVFVVGFLDADAYHDFHFADSVPLTKCLRDYLEEEVDEKYYLSDDRTFELTGKQIGAVAKLTDTKFESAQRIQGVNGIASTLITQQGGDQEPKILVKRNQLNPLYKSQCNTIHDIDGVAPSLCAGTHGYAYGYIREPISFKWSITPPANWLFRIRRLTPRECFRLMGMNDSDIALVNSDTQSYKIAGNGIEINTMRSIIRQLYKPVKSKNSLF